jgi:hypothetical protein
VSQSFVVIEFVGYLLLPFVYKVSLRLFLDHSAFSSNKLSKASVRCYVPELGMSVLLLGYIVFHRLFHIECWCLICLFEVGVPVYILLG